ncbi:hypothetical protein [Maribacter sp. LLG6340-A2]|uniref:hypothetical protein n=1 Tax=Maribacter sp. LLG6340-A2 TaxID=3160834 RepID=UPI0038698EB7
MNKQESVLDSKTIANGIVLLAIMLSALLYFNNAAEIEREVATVISSSLNDVNHSLAEQESRK